MEIYNGINAALGQHIEEIVARATAVLEQQRAEQARQRALVNRPGRGALCRSRMQRRHG